MNEKAERAAAWMEALAADPAHGYDQASRWGPDYDCSSAVISAWEAAGVPVRAAGAGYTGNMYKAFLDSGFRDVTGQVDLNTGRGLKRGDVLLNHKHHAAIYCGGGREAEAAINELGTATGGQTGDQTGREIYVRPYRNYPWDCVLRYGGDDVRPGPGYWYKIQLPLLKPGMEDSAVTTVQRLLSALGYEPGDADGIFGARTAQGVEAFQRDQGLEADGEVGGQTWRALLGV